MINLRYFLIGAMSPIIVALLLIIWDNTTNITDKVKNLFFEIFSVKQYVFCENCRMRVESKQIIKYDFYGAEAGKTCHDCALTYFDPQ